MANAKLKTDEVRKMRYCSLSNLEVGKLLELTDEATITLAIRKAIILIGEQRELEKELEKL